MNDTNTQKQQLFQVVEEMRPQIIGFLQRLIQIPSENPPGNYIEISTFLQEALTELGFDVQVISVPDEMTRAAGLPTPRINVIATLRGSGGGRNLIFNSHLDTVPAGDPEQWDYPPFSGTIDNGRIYGRGATDSKGRLSAYIMAAVALARTSLTRKGDVMIAATCDEETGGILGAGYINQNGHVHGDMVIVEGYSNHIVRAMAGVLQLKITTDGIPAHAGYKWKGLNAVEKMAKVVCALEALQKELEQEPSSIPGMKYTTVNIGTIQGGTKVNVVPAACEIEVDFRVIPEHSLDQIYSRVESLLEALEQEDPAFKVNLTRITDFQTDPTITKEDSPLISELQQAVQEVTAHTLPVVGVLAQADTRWFIQNGIPGINYGPGTSENNIHGFNECMEIEDLIQTTKILTVLAKNIVC
ncbi:MAG: acetylornithine deacetylase or succinyl-diaminopimelate desuccinylase [Brevibacillus sp.]|nr:acetylornithine deacetylase or succinyl-diaminopimelate desuccinylase [Brevibacillus sp.]